MCLRSPDQQTTNVANLFHPFLTCLYGLMAGAKILIKRRGKLIIEIKDKVKCSDKELMVRAGLEPGILSISKA